MKSPQHTVLAAALLIGIALLAGSVTASNPFAPATSPFPNGNTPFPVTTGGYMQIKGATGPATTGGGLVIGGSFVAMQNAAFDKDLGIQGILTGNPALDCQNNPSASNNLCFGKFSATSAQNNIVDVDIAGTTYAQAGALYAPLESAPSGKHQSLCALQNGEIVICPGSTPITPLSIPTIDGTLSFTARRINIALELPVPEPQAVTFMDIESMVDVAGTLTPYSSSITIPVGGSSGNVSPTTGYPVSCIFPSNVDASGNAIFEYNTQSANYVLTIPSAQACN
jgi:hypothetical protein